MLVKTTARIVTCFVYDKKDKATNEPTGEKGLMISLLIDEKKEDKLSGKIISPFVDPKTYKGILSFGECQRLEEVEVEMDVPTSPKGMFVLYNLNRLKK